MRDDPPPPPALAELGESELTYTVVRYERARDVEESSSRQGIAPSELLKTLVVRRGEGDYLFVLVPGDREMDWPRLRAHLGVSRITMPDAAEAAEATGYERGTITPFGATRRWPVLADSTIAALAKVSIGAGVHGMAVHLAGRDLLDYLGAEQAHITNAG